MQHFFCIFLGFVHYILFQKKTKKAKQKKIHLTIITRFFCRGAGVHLKDFMGGYSLFLLFLNVCVCVCFVWTNTHISYDLKSHAWFLNVQSSRNYFLFKKKDLGSFFHSRVVFFLVLGYCRFWGQYMFYYIYRILGFIYKKWKKKVFFIPIFLLEFRGINFIHILRCLEKRCEGDVIIEISLITLPLSPLYHFRH